MYGMPPSVEKGKKNFHFLTNNMEKKLHLRLGTKIIQRKEKKKSAVFCRHRHIKHSMCVCMEIGKSFFLDIEVNGLS
jgi:hypothetical protein